MNAAEAWPILDSCPAPRHNRLSSARGDGKVPKCVCPYAVKLLEQYRKRRHERESISATVGRPKYTNPAVGVRGTPPMENLARGACRTPHGMEIMDAYVDAPHTERYVNAARKLCNRECPVRLACERWVQQAEIPAGSWYVMIAGMTRIERARAGRKTA